MNNTIKVISLARSLERRKTFSEVNSHVDFEFFDAVDGAQVLPEVSNAPDLFESGLRYNAGAYGCALSHLNLWQEAAASGRVITVLEDDAILRHDFGEQSTSILSGLSPGWDMVVWGWNFDSILSLNVMPNVSPAVMLFEQGKMRESTGEFQRMTAAPGLLRLDKCFGTPAYSISPDGARKFMATCFPLKNFELYFPVLNRQLPNNGIDIAMNRIYSATNTFCSVPPLAVTKNEHATSLIQRRGAATGSLGKKDCTQNKDSNTAPTAIPRLVHRIWFGDRAIPAEYEKYWEAWQRQLPDFEFRTWRENDVADFRTSAIIASADGMARKADIARYEILLTHGGIYLDCETAHLAAQIGSIDPAPTIEFCDLAKAARVKALEAVKHQVAERYLTIENKAPLDLLKAGIFLLSQIPSALVWQIGAADGVLVDPLRALLVNFDPPAVLLEPNPYLHEMLIANYRRNTQMKFVKAALCETGEKLTMNAVNPHKVRERPLPEWVLGISSAFTDRNPIGGKGIDAETTRLIGECLETIEADVVDVDYLLSLNNGIHPAIVVIDAEGMDAPLLNLIVSKGIMPLIIHFERQWLSADESDMVAALLDKEYVTIPHGNDVVAFRADFFATYCEHLYVENGIHTIYRKAIKFALNIA